MKSAGTTQQVTKFFFNFIPLKELPFLIIKGKEKSVFFSCTVFSLFSKHKNHVFVIYFHCKILKALCHLRNQIELSFTYFSAYSMVKFQ